VLLVSAWLALFGFWLPLDTKPVPRRRGAAASAVVGRQVGLLNFRGATAAHSQCGLPAPGFAQDVAAVPSSPLIAVSVATPFGQATELGAIYLAWISQHSSKPR